MKQTRTIKSLAQHIILLVVTLSLSACLVDTSDPPTLKRRTTDSMRLIQDGDFYDYIVRGQVTTGGTTSSFEGTMSITYVLAQMPQPFGGGNINRLREDIELSLGGSLYTLSRFIEQDTNGSISILATVVGNPPSATYYRPKYTSTPVNVPEPIEILNSNDPVTGGIPLSGTVELDYQYMENCEASSPCGLVVQRISDLDVNNETTLYQGNADVVTNLGRYEAIRIDYFSRFTTFVTTMALFDIRGACDTEDANFFSSEYIFPEVGVVYMEHSCTSLSGGGHNYTASLVNTNVPIP